jgi:P27 family predicted phage terminase small subunit
VALKDKNLRRFAVIEGGAPALETPTSSPAPSRPIASSPSLIDAYPEPSASLLKDLKAVQRKRVLDRHRAKREIWTELLDLYRDRLTDADRETFGKLVDQTFAYRSAMIQVDNVGQVTLSPKGYPIYNPYLAIANRADAAILKLMIQLGLTPASRSRVKGNKPKRGSNAFGNLRRLDE